MVMLLRQSHFSVTQIIIRDYKDQKDVKKSIETQVKMVNGGWSLNLSLHGISCNQWNDFQCLSVIFVTKHSNSQCK